MSHFSRIKTSIREIDLLKKSLTNLNLVWEEKEQLIKGYKNETHKVNLVIKQNNNIDIGFEKTAKLAEQSWWTHATASETKANGAAPKAADGKGGAPGKGDGQSVSSHPMLNSRPTSLDL